jgi:LacI family transcriptional regulator/LacI family repressor for deo operon, udp, cdd, tsx, nupC, and nupG
MRRSVSIEDIAQAAGVSHATVSRALRGNSRISPQVRELVQRLAEEMGYTPNAVAQSLKGQRTHTVGLVVTSISDPFYGRLARGVDEGARQANMDVFLGVSGNRPDEEMAVIESFQRRRVEGIITASSRLSDEQLARLAREGTPAVLVNRQSEGMRRDLPSVQVDNFGGALLAMRHLIALGHEAIAYLGAANRPVANRERERGYWHAMREAQFSPRAAWVRTGAVDRRSYSDDVEDGRALMVEALRENVTAAFCFNDMHAVGALMACREAGAAVPGDVSIVGFDDVDTARYVSPPLTTAHQPKLRLGQIAIGMLLRLMAGEPVEDECVGVELVTRASTGPVRKRNLTSASLRDGPNLSGLD